MLEKIIKLTNEYIESMPKKNVKNTDSFLPVWRLLGLWQDCIMSMKKEEK